MVYVSDLENVLARYYLQYKPVMKTIDPSTYENQKIHKILLGGVAPRPIAFASTINKEGQVNLSPFSFYNAFGVNPTTLIFSPSRRGVGAEPGDIVRFLSIETGFL